MTWIDALIYFAFLEIGIFLGFFLACLFSVARDD